MYLQSCLETAFSHWHDFKDNCPLMDLLQHNQNCLLQVENIFGFLLEVTEDVSVFTHKLGLKVYIHHILHSVNLFVVGINKWGVYIQFFFFSCVSRCAWVSVMELSLQKIDGEVFVSRWLLKQLSDLKLQSLWLKKNAVSNLVLRWIDFPA